MFDLLLCISSSAAARNRRHSIDAIPIILLRRMHASGDSEKALYNDNAFSLINSTKSTFKAILSENSIPNHTIRPTVYKAFGLFLANFSNVCFRTFPIPFGCRAQFFDVIIIIPIPTAVIIINSRPNASTASLCRTPSCLQCFAIFCDSFFSHMFIPPFVTIFSRFPYWKQERWRRWQEFCRRW